jgi:adrenodoxin-NADP+ reductase
MTDAFQTAEAIVEDWKQTFQSVDLGKRAGWKGVQAEAQSLDLRLRPVHWPNWQQIDHAERAVGAERGKPREKFGSVAEMLDATGR